MDYFNDALATFLGLERFSCVAVYFHSDATKITILGSPKKPSMKNWTFLFDVKGSSWNIRRQ